MSFATALHTDDRPADYEVKHTERGIIIRGDVPGHHVGHLMAIAEADGFDVWSIQIGQALGATFVFTNAEHAAAWQVEIDATMRRRYPHDPIKAWFAAGHGGTSARTIAATLGTDPTPWRHFTPAPPYDAADVARCVVLLDLQPEWRGRLDEVATAHPAWASLVEAWDEVEELSRQGEATALDARMIELVERPAGMVEIDMKEGAS